MERALRFKMRYVIHYLQKITTFAIMKWNVKHIALIFALTLSASSMALTAAPLAPARVEVIASEPIVKASYSGVDITAPTGDTPIRIAIYSITGQLVKSAQLAPASNIHFDLPRGCYIVKAGNNTVKIVVR